jgi:hypothetical protein
MPQRERSAATRSSTPTTSRPRGRRRSTCDIAGLRRPATLRLTHGRIVARIHLHGGPMRTCIFYGATLVVVPLGIGGCSGRLTTATHATTSVDGGGEDVTSAQTDATMQVDTGGPEQDVLAAQGDATTDGAGHPDAGRISCSVNSDCGNPYLACAPTLNSCVPSYQLPCKMNSDCGPAGFICNPNAHTSCTPAGCMPIAGCESQYTGMLCSSDSDCPAGWSCYAPPPPQGGPPGGGPPEAMRCYPPFASFNGATGAGPSGP